jgi:hypothetical protein
MPDRRPEHTTGTVGYRVQAMLEAVQTVEPPLRDFYSTLDDEQQARFNTLGTQIVASGR